MKLTPEERAQAFQRASKEPRRRKDGRVCIGGIGKHGECYGHGASLDCPYCIPDQIIETEHDIRRAEAEYEDGIQEIIAEYGPEEHPNE